MAILVKLILLLSILLGSTNAYSDGMGGAFLETGLYVYVGIAMVLSLIIGGFCASLSSEVDTSPAFAKGFFWGMAIFVGGPILLIISV